MKKPLLLLILFAGLTVHSDAQKTVREISESRTNILEPPPKNSPVKILYKPRAVYPKPEKGTICVTGTVTLKIEFLASGKIGEIAVVNGLPLGLTENSVEAAKKIKFKPALKDGQAVTAFKTVTFSFGLY